MKLRKLLTLLVLVTGAFFALSNQDLKAQPGGHMCDVSWDWCTEACMSAYETPGTWKYHNGPEFTRCWVSCDAGQYACYTAGAWQSWLIQYNENISNDPYMIIDNGPDPICAIYPDRITDCGNLGTAEEIEACVMVIQEEQARFHCP